MKKMKSASTQQCSFCGNRAVWKCQNCAFVQYACTAHAPHLQEYEEEHQDDGHMSEADWQTWGRVL